MSLATNLNESQVLALTLWAEARSDGLAGMVAVAAVILNRYNDPHTRYGNTIREVCLKKWQFSCWWEKGANRKRLEEMTQRLREGGVTPEPYGRALDIARGVLAAGKAKHYMTEQLFENRPPTWARGRIPDRALGNHIFFVGVDDEAA